MGSGGGTGALGETSTSPLLGGAGDVTYPYYLVNGRVPTAPQTFSGEPGQRVRLRIVNAGTDTAFRVALAGHPLRVTHTDGYPAQPTDTDALLVAMGERFDVEVTLGDGIFPLVAVPEGKTGTPPGDRPDRRGYRAGGDRAAGRAGPAGAARQRPARHRGRAASGQKGESQPRPGCWPGR